VTEALNADSLLQYGGTPANSPGTNSSMAGVGSWAIAPLSVTELSQFAFQIATMQ
jgi:hypothetical protein